MAFILDDILLAPCKLAHWIGKELYEHAEAEVTDESVIRQHLLELEMRFELDDISEDEYQKEEGKLMRRLQAIREYKESRRLN
jgi:hypothetical protein